jgi:hypothetical protein
MRRVIAAALGDSTEPPPRDSTEPWPEHQCGRLLVGQGGETWDPVCIREAGHPGACQPHPSAHPRVTTGYLREVEIGYAGDDPRPSVATVIRDGYEDQEIKLDPSEVGRLMALVGKQVRVRYSPDLRRATIEPA